MTKKVIETIIKWIPELPEVQKRAEEASEKYFRSVEKVLSALVQKYGKKNGWPVYELPYKFDLLARSIENDVSKDNDDPFVWKLDEIQYYPEDEDINLHCEGYDFNVRDFEMGCLHDLCHEIDITDGKGPEDDDENQNEKDDKEEE